MRNLIVLSKTVPVHIGGPKILGDAGALPHWVTSQTHYCPTRVIVPNVIALGQTILGVCRGRWGAAHLGWGHV